MTPSVRVFAPSCVALALVVACHHAPPQATGDARADALGSYEYSVSFSSGTWSGRFEVLRDSASVEPREGYCHRADFLTSANVADSFRCEGVPGAERVTLHINRLHPLQSYWAGVNRQAYEVKTNQCAAYTTTPTGQICTRYATRTEYRDVPVNGTLRVTARLSASR